MDMTGMTSMIPAWITPVAWLFLLSALISATLLAYTITTRGSRSAVAWVWPLSALFLGPAALVAYARWGRQAGPTGTGRWPAGAPLVVALLSGAAASTVAHLIGVPLVFGAGWTIAGDALWAVALFILILATALLFLAEYTASARSRPSLPAGPSTTALMLASFLTVLAFDVGMVGWMLFLHMNMLMAPATDVVFIFQMQLGMLLGMLTAWPVVAWFTSRRILAATVQPAADPMTT